MAEVHIPRRIAFLFYLLLFLGGIIFYISWGLAYSSWNLLDHRWVGVYAVVIMLVGFGLVGMLLYKE